MTCIAAYIYVILLYLLSLWSKWCCCGVYWL